MKKQSPYWRKKLQQNRPKVTRVDDWTDIKGNVYDSKTEAQISSFMIIIHARLRDGFPVVVPFLWHNAMAVWPFIFIHRKKIASERLNHEMIHIRQQWEMLVVFAYVWYAAELFIRLFMCGSIRKAYFMHSMEREARENQWNANYIINRKHYSFIKYIHLKMLIIGSLTTQETIDAVHTQPAGTVVIIQISYEQGVYMLNLNKPSDVSYEDILPGTESYSLYGPQSLMKMDVTG